MSKEPNGTLVMTTCKCREHGTNLVMTRTWFDETLQGKIAQGAKCERERIVELLKEIWLDYPPIENTIALIEGKTND